MKKTPDPVVEKLDEILRELKRIEAKPPAYVPYAQPYYVQPYQAQPYYPYTYPYPYGTWCYTSGSNVTVSSQQCQLSSSFNG
jgi:hypothetical protein